MREMKFSGVEWIGDIPKEWETKSIRSMLIERNEKNRQLSIKTILSLSAKDGVTLYNSETHSGNKPKEDLSDYKIVRINDIVINSMNILSGSVGLSKYEGVVSPVYYIYYPRKEDNTDYLHMIFQCFEFQRSLRGLGNGILIKETESGALNTIRMRIPAKKLALQEFPCPPVSEQNAIAGFLRIKYMQIDSLIANAEQQIAKLKAYKQSVITETLSPNDSWHRCKLGFIASFKNGLNYNGTITDENIKFLGVGDFQDNFIIDDENMLSTLLFDGSVPQDLLLQNGDIVFVRSNGSKELVGRSVLLENITFPLTFSGFCIRMRNKRTDLVLNKFLLYSFWSSRFRQTLNQESKGFNINNLNQGILSKFLVYYPDTQRQKEIIEILDTKRSQIDRLITLKQQKIEKLQQYKKSIIYEYVTGKKEV